MKHIYVCFKEVINQVSEPIEECRCAFEDENFAKNWSKAAPLEKRWYEQILLYEGKAP